MIDLTQLRGGFCDRLRLATWGIARARLAGSEKLVLRDQGTSNCPYLFREICRVEGMEVVDWQESDGPIPNHRFAPRIFPARLADVRETLPSGWKGSAASFQKLWLAAYTLLRPQAGIAELVATLGLGSGCLGLQLRYTDKVRQRARGWMELEERQIPEMDAHLLRMLEKSKFRRLFVAADNRASKELWCRRLESLGYSVICHQTRFEPDRWRQTGAEDFGVDLFALAACGSVLGTSRSGVVYTVDWMNGRRRSRFAIDGMFWSMVRRQLSQLLGMRR